MANENNNEKKIEENIVNQETTETVETEQVEKPLFDPQSFIEGMVEGDMPESNMEDIDKEKTEENEEVKKNVEEKTVAEATAEVKVDDSNDILPEPTIEETFISKIATDLGVSASSYEELIDNINRKQVIVKENEVVKRIDTLSNMTDESLVKAWLGTRPDYTEDEVEERITIWHNTGELKHQAKDIRSQLEERRKQYIDEEKNKQISEEAKRKEIAEGFNKSLNDTVSKTSALYEGAYNLVDDEKTSLVEYITTGQFQKDILSDPYKLIEASHFVKNRDAAIKIIRQQGISDGTQKALGNIRPIDNRTGGYIPNDGSKGVFDARKFMSGFDSK